jgi:hypothetical protein
VVDTKSCHESIEQLRNKISVSKPVQQPSGDGESLVGVFRVGSEFQALPGKWRDFKIHVVTCRRRTSNVELNRTLINNLKLNLKSQMFNET